MRVCTALTMLFLLSEGWPGVFGITVFTVTEGENVTAECLFSFSGINKTFCKDYSCQNDDILVDTTENTATNGNYSIRYDEKERKMYVSISQVQLSDSGHYWCKLVKESSYGFTEEKIHVIIAVVTTHSQPTIRPESDHQSTQGPVIIGLIVAGILTLICVALIVLWFYCKKKGNRSQVL